MKFKYDVAISYASEDEKLVGRVFVFLKNMGLSVFYAPECKEEFIAQNMAERFNRLYREDALFVAAFISNSYIRKDYTMLEAKTAMHRHETEGRYCLIPVLLDGTALPGLSPDIHYINAAKCNEVDIAHDIGKAVMSYKNKLGLPSMAQQDHSKNESERQCGNTLETGDQRSTGGDIININGISNSSITLNKR